jgi:hypothetical protein
LAFGVGVDKDRAFFGQLHQAFLIGLIDFEKGVLLLVC